MTFFSICLGENHQRVQESLVSMGTICFPPLYYIDIHLLQKIILIRRIVHDMKYYIPFIKSFFFQPFSREEVSQYIWVHCKGEEWKHYTTTPYVLSRCLLGDMDYDVLVNSLVRSFLDQACSQMLSSKHDRLLASLFSLLMAGCTKGKDVLLKCGFVYVNDNDKLQLVYDKSIVFNNLISIAEKNYELFASYSIGAAEELLFSYHCQSGHYLWTKWST